MALGCYQLGWMYGHGSGVAADKLQASKLYQKACDADSMKACLALGRMYASGDGIPRNRSSATSLLKKACDGGEAEACQELKQPRRSSK